MSEAEGTYGNPPPTLDLYIGGMPFSMTAIEVRDLFSREGFPVSSVKVRAGWSLASVLAACVRVRRGASAAGRLSRRPSRGDPHRAAPLTSAPARAAYH